MDISLNLPAGPRQREFLDYLNSALRARLASGSGSAGRALGGTFFSELSGPFPVGQGHVDLTWTIVKESDGTITRFSVEATDSALPAISWQTAAYEFATSVLAATLAEKRQHFFRRSQFFYIGPQLDGEYWLPGYRFAPAFEEDPEPFLINAERVVSIDQDIYAIDDMHALALAEESSRRHAAHLSLLLNVGLYRQEQVMRWILPRTNGLPAAESVRGLLAFRHHGPALSEMPEKGQVCKLGGNKGSLASRYRVAGELLSLPKEARRILRGINQADALVVNAFDRGARLYQVGSVCGRLFPSVGLAYRVAAVEAMSASDPTCSGFSEFMRKHVTSRSDIEGILQHLYGRVRSAHFHSGAFPMGEFDLSQDFDPMMDVDSVKLDSTHQACYELTREAIVNWMQSMVPADDIHPALNAAISGAQSFP